MKASKKVRYGLGGVLVLLLAGGVLSDSFLKSGGSTDVSSEPASAEQGVAATAIRAATPGVIKVVVAPGGAQADGEDVYEARPGAARLQLAPVPISDHHVAEPETATAGEEIDPIAQWLDLAGGPLGGAGAAGGFGGGGGAGGGGAQTNPEAGGGRDGGDEPGGPPVCALGCKAEPPIVVSYRPLVAPPGDGDPPPQFLPPENETPKPQPDPPTFMPEPPMWTTPSGGPGPVPEPDTWAMLLIGFFAVGALLRAGALKAA